MTASVLKQDPNTKRFKRTLIYFNTDTQYAHFRGNPLYQVTERHLNNRSCFRTLAVILFKFSLTMFAHFKAMCVGVRLVE